MKDKMRYSYTKTSNVIGWIVSKLLTVILVILIALIGNMILSGEDHIMGWKPVLIQTGSMEPVIHTDGFIIGDILDEDESLAVGDIVGFQIFEEGRTKNIVHRIHSYNEEKGIYITKGDNNPNTDLQPLTRENIRFKVAYINNDFKVVNEFVNGPNKSKIILGAFVIGAYLLVNELHKSIKLDEVELDRYKKTGKVDKDTESDEEDDLVVKEELEINYNIIEEKEEILPESSKLIKDMNEDEIKEYLKQLR